MELDESHQKKEDVVIDGRSWVKESFVSSCFEIFRKTVINFYIDNFTWIDQLNQGIKPVRPNCKLISSLQCYFMNFLGD